MPNKTLIKEVRDFLEVTMGVNEKARNEGLRQLFREHCKGARMDEKELEDKIVLIVSRFNLGGSRDRAREILNLCREFLTTKTSGEEWWVGVSNDVGTDTDGEEFRITTVARKNNRSIGKVWQVVPVKIDTESPRSKLIKRLREKSHAPYHVWFEIAELLEEAANELEKPTPK